jgi:hypothetical protein
MNERDRQGEEKGREEESGDTHPPVPVINTAEFNQGGPKGTEHGKNAATLNHVTRTARFKRWASEITIAEVGMFFLTVVIAVSTTCYTIYANKQWPDIHTQAEAAKSAADTAKDALHISERAYVNSGSPNADDQRKTIVIPLINSGRLPAENVVSVLFEVTINPKASGLGPTNLADTVERNKGITHFPVITPGPSPVSVVVPAPKMSAKLLNTGKQQIEIAGIVTYGDGLPDTLSQASFVCLVTMYQTLAKAVYWTPCNTGKEIARLASLDWTGLTTEH